MPLLNWTHISQVQIEHFEITLKNYDQVTESIYSEDRHITRLAPPRWTGNTTIRPFTGELRIADAMDQLVKSNFQLVIHGLADPRNFFKVKLPADYPRLRKMGRPMKFYWNTGNYAQRKGMRQNTWTDSSAIPVSGMYVTNGKRVWRINGVTYSNNQVFIQDFIPNDVLPRKSPFDAANQPSGFGEELWWAEFIYARPIRNSEGTGIVIQTIPNDYPRNVYSTGIWAQDWSPVTISWEQQLLTTRIAADIPPD